VGELVEVQGRPKTTTWTETKIDQKSRLIVRGEMDGTLLREKDKTDSILFWGRGQICGKNIARKGGERAAKEGGVGRKIEV